MERDHVQHSLEELNQALEDIRDSESYVKWIDFQSRFHKYSPSNVLLIMMQRPDASMVAGYRAWQRMNRFVMQGEKSIRILGPIRRAVENEETGEKEMRVFGYRSVSVFDVSQTDGQELPSFEVPELMGEDGKGLYDRLSQVLYEEGIKIEDGGLQFRGRPHMMGFYEREMKKIGIRLGISQLQKTKTLAHEGAHHFANHRVSDEDSEVQAESIAHIVLKRFNLHPDERSVPYIATWAQNKDVLKRNMAMIAHTSRFMIDRIAPQETVAPEA